jgi:alpha-ribazole phosphatase
MTDRLIDLLRHGEVQGGSRFRGRQDDPLTAEGWAQMRAAVDRCGVEGALWGLVAHSPAQRCAAFARSLAERRGIPHRCLEDLRERDFGSWEGLRADQIPIEELSLFWADPQRYGPSDAEPFDAFRARVLQGWRQILERDDPHPLVITHGGVVRLIVGEVLGIDPPRLLLLEVPPACRTRLRVPGIGRASLVSHGCLQCGGGRADGPLPVVKVPQ